MLYRVNRTFILFFCVIFAQAVQATISGGIDWLQGQANPDGSLATPNGISIPYQSTAEALRAFSAAHTGETAVIQAAKAFVSDNPFHSTEYLAREILVLAANGEDVTEQAQALWGHQNPDGGFGELPGFDSTVLDTAYALEALSMFGPPSDESVGYAIEFIASRQTAAGGWSLKNNDPSVAVTAQVLIALQQYRYVYDVTSEIDLAVNYLLEQMAASGAIGEVYESALSLLALAPLVSDRSRYQALLDYLISAQRTDGSWNDDLFTSALAVRAWQAQQTATPPQPGLAVIAGYVRDGETGEPLAGVSVSVTLTSGETHQAASDSLGRYQINDLAAGSVTIAASLSGYHTVSVTGTLVAGQALAFNPELSPQPQPQRLDIRGGVIDAVTSLPISGATVRVVNSGYATQSASDGGFAFTGLPAGSATLEVTQSGYATTRLALSAPAGGAMDLGLVSLTPDSDTATTGTVTGLMTDGITGEPLRGVLISLSGADNKTVYTDVDGRFMLDEVAPGNLTLVASLSGYNNVNGSADLAAGSALQFNGALVKQNNPATVTLTGNVIDAQTHQALSGVQVSVDGVQSYQTDARGEFYASGLQLTGELTVTYRLSGYNTATVYVEAAPGSLINLSGIALAPDIPVTDNQPPRIDSVGPGIVSIGQKYVYQVSATDPEGDSLTYTLSDHPVGMEIDTNTGVINWIPTSDQTGAQFFILIVSDPEGAIAVQNVAVSVSADDQIYIVTDVETLNSLTLDAPTPDNYVLGRYLTGGRPETWRAGSAQGCGNAYTDDPIDPASPPEAANALDFWAMGTGNSSDAVWDMGTVFSSVSVLPFIDHEPFPQEGVDYTIWGSNNPDAPFPEGWTLATLVSIYSQGWADNRAQCSEAVNM